MLLHSRRVIRSSQGMKERRKTFLMRSALSVASFFLLVAFTAWVVRLPSFALEPVTVAGISDSQKELIRSYAEEKIAEKYFLIFPKANIFLYPRGSIEEGLLDFFPQLESASVSLDSSRSLHVLAKERKPAYLSCQSPAKILSEKSVSGETSSIESDTVATTKGDVCYFVDSRGVIFEEAPHFSGPVYFTLYGKPTGANVRPGNKSIFPKGFSVLSPEEFNQLVALKDNLNGLGIKVASVTLKEDGDREFLVQNGVRILWSKAQSVDTSLQNLSAAFEAGIFGEKDLIRENSRLDYLDLRFGKKVFYKFK